MNPQEPLQTPPPTNPEPLPQPPVQPLATPPVPTPTPTSATSPEDDKVLSENPFTRPNTIFDNSPAPWPFKRKPSKKLFAVLASVAVLVLGGGAYAFFFYLPNRPTAVFSSSVDRSGEAFKQVVERSVEKSKLERFAKSDMKLTIESAYGQETFSGSLSAQFDEVKSNALLVLKSNTEDLKLDLKADFMSEILAGKQFPEAYFRLGGLTALGELGMLPPSITAYDNKWISVDSAYLESMLGGSTTEATKTEQLTSDDVAEMAKAAAEVTADRVFTTDPSKAVFENKGFIKEEQVNGTAMNQYSVSLNEANVKNYCKALAERLIATNGYKKVPFWGSDVEQAKTSTQKECDAISLKNTDENTFQMWVDKERKLMHKIRINEKGKTDNYVEIGQNYTGGDEVGFFVNYNKGETQLTATMTMTLNMAAGSAKGSMQFESKDPKSPYKMLLELDAKPFEGEVEVTPPTESTPIQDVLKQLGF